MQQECRDVSMQLFAAKQQQEIDTSGGKLSGCYMISHNLKYMMIMTYEIKC